MSLSRLALRLAAVEALCPATALVTKGPFPTVAADRVDDSRVDLIENAQSPEELDAALTLLENKPLLVVYTEEHDTSPYGEVKFDADENVVTLVIEAMIGAKGQIEVGHDLDGSPIYMGSLEAPVTDRQHEAMLDLLESQVKFILDPKKRAPSAALYRKVAWETRKVHSDPQRAADRTVRLATRTIKFHVKLASEAWPVAPAAGLPEPLATVAAGLPPGSSGAVLCAALSPFASVSPALPVPPVDSVNPNGIAATFTVDRPPGADPDLTVFVPYPQPS